MESEGGAGSSAQSHMAHFVWLVPIHISVLKREFPLVNPDRVYQAPAAAGGCAHTSWHEWAAACEC